MARLTVFCALVIVISVAYAVDICKTTSISQQLVDGLTDFTPYGSLTTLSAINAQLAALSAAAVAISSTAGGLNWGGAFIGFQTGEMYGIIGCDNTVDCSGSPQLFAVTNPTFFGDNNVYLFTRANASSEYGWDSGPYDFRNKEWYTKATASLWGTDQWTVNPLVQDGLLGFQQRDVYAYRKAFTVPSAGVVAGFRSAREPCGTCYVPTFPQTVVINHAATWFPSGDGVATTADFQRYIDFLLPYVVNNTAAGSSFTSAGYINFIVGYFTGNSFMIKDCGFMSGGGSAQCSHAGTVRYQLWLTAPDVFGNITRQVFQIGADGLLGPYVGVGNSPAAPSGSYDVTTRGFYLATDGWTNVNTIADATATLNRRFVIASGFGLLPGGNHDAFRGVVGGEFIDAGEGVCTGGSSGAAAVAVSLMTVVMIVLAMLQL